jgi:hypothetical protein
MVPEHKSETARLLDTFFTKNEALAKHLEHECRIRFKQLNDKKHYKNWQLLGPVREALKEYISENLKITI